MRQRVHPARGASLAYMCCPSYWTRLHVCSTGSQLGGTKAWMQGLHTMSAASLDFFSGVCCCLPTLMSHEINQLINPSTQLPSTHPITCIPLLQELRARGVSELRARSPTRLIRFWDRCWGDYQARLMASRTRRRELQMQRRMQALGLREPAA